MTEMAEKPKKGKTKPCSECGVPMDAKATKCPECHADYVRRCCSCAEPIHRLATRCKGCNAFQGGLRRYFSISDTFLALLIALFSVIANVFAAGSYLLGRQSETTVKVTTADENTLRLAAWNTGQKPAALTEFRVRFPHLPIEDVILDLTDEDRAQAKTLVMPGNPMMIGVTIPELRPQKPKEAGLYTKVEMMRLLDEARLRGMPLAVEVRVEESGHVWNLLSPSPYTRMRSEEVPVDRLYVFLLGRMSDEH